MAGVGSEFLGGIFFLIVKVQMMDRLIFDNLKDEANIFDDGEFFFFNNISLDMKSSLYH